MNESEGYGFKHPEPWTPRAAEPPQRAVGSPLPMGGGYPPQPSFEQEPQPQASGPMPGRAPGRSLATPPADPLNDLPNTVQKAVNAVRMAIPFVQRLLPLLDGNIASTVSNLLTPHPGTQKPSPPVNLAPLEDGLADLQTQHRDLRNVLVEQNSSLKRVEDQLEMVREATDRNTLEQQELMEDLKSVGGRVNLVAAVALGLLAASLIVNLILYLHLRRVLP